MRDEGRNHCLGASRSPVCRIPGYAQWRSRPVSTLHLRGYTFVCWNARLRSRNFRCEWSETCNFLKLGAKRCLWDRIFIYRSTNSIRIIILEKSSWEYFHYMSKACVYIYACISKKDSISLNFATIVRGCVERNNGLDQIRVFSTPVFTSESSWSFYKLNTYSLTGSRELMHYAKKIAERRRMVPPHPERRETGRVKRKP